MKATSRKCPGRRALTLAAPGANPAGPGEAPATFCSVSRAIAENAGPPHPRKARGGSPLPQSHSQIKR